VKLGATITLAADLTIDFGVGIEIWGGGFGFNLTAAYKIIVNGTRGTFRNVAFTGTTQLNGTAVVNSQPCIEVDDSNFGVLKMIECRFNDIIGSTTGAYATAATAPIHILDCDNWTIFEFLFFGIGSQTSSGSTKYQGPLYVFWTPSGKSGTRLVFKDLYNNSPERSNQSTRFERYRDSLTIRIDGALSTAYQNQVVYDETLTIDSASTWPTTVGQEPMDLYPNMYGSSTVITSNDPTSVATYGVPGDVVISGSTIYMKHTDVGSDTDWKTI